MTTKDTPMSAERDIVDELQALLDKATPRPWFASPYRHCIGSQVWAGTPGPDTATLICGDGDADDDNATLIATAVNSLPDLLAEITRLREALAQSPEDAEWLREFANGAPGPSRESRARLEAIANRLSGVRE